jgi:indolepyruvate ferredoxin oxidoreductase, beta subunit
VKTDIILAGVGGQGILSIATVIASAALKENLYIKQSEVHGMSQRGGAVHSHLRISDKPIASDLIPLASADLILSLEPMESLRYVPFLSPSGWLVSNETPFININNYPEPQKIFAAITDLPHHVVINADDIAKSLNSPRSSNMVILGAASPFINLRPASFEMGINEIFSRKGTEIVQININAFEAGLAHSRQKTGK